MLQIQQLTRLYYKINSEPIPHIFLSSSNKVYFHSDPFMHVNSENYSLTHCSIVKFRAYTAYFWHKSMFWHMRL